MRDNLEGLRLDQGAIVGQGKLGSNLMLILLCSRLLMVKYNHKKEAKLWVEECLVQALPTGTISIT